MRTVIISLVIVFSSLLIFGQEKKNDKNEPEKEQLIFEGSAGVSLPFGTYAERNRENENAGFADPGFLIQFTGAWMGKYDLGLAIQYSFQRNPLISAAHNDTLEGRTYPIGPGNWSNHYALIGGVYNKQIKKFLVNVKLMGGLVFAFSPLFNYTSLDSLHKQTTGYGSGFAYQVAVAGGYSISPRWHLKLEASLLGGIPTFHKQYGGEYLYTATTRDPQTGAIRYYNVYAPAVLLDLKNYINTFNVSLGVVFKL